MCYARRQRSSWARIKLSKNLYQICGSPQLQSFELSYLSFFYFVWVYITLLDEISSFAHTMLCTSLLLFNFQWPFLASALADSSTIISYLFSLVKHFFKNFSNFFFCALVWYPPFFAECHNSTILFCFCQEIFQKKSEKRAVFCSFFFILLSFP